MNLTALTQAVYNRAGVATTDGLITSAVVLDAINEALHALEMDGDWPWLQKNQLFATVAGTGTYSMPADWMRTLDVRFDTTDGVEPDSTILSQEPFELLERWAMVANGSPSEWSVLDDQLVLRPIPDAVYQIRHTYLRPEIDLASGSDTPIMPANEHMGLVQYATYIVLRRDNEDPRANQAWTAYQAWVARDRSKRRRVLKPWKVHVRDGYQL